MVSGIEVTLSETKNVIICVATGTAPTKHSTSSSSSSVSLPRKVQTRKNIR